MNHSKHLSERSDAAKTTPILMALCTIGLVAALDAQRPASADDVRMAKVSVADLDLGTTAGMKAAQGRVRKVAQHLCAQVAQMDDLSRHDNYLACVDASVTAAMQQLKGPALAALAEQKLSTTP
jgi:UrcA family protein